MTTLAELTAIVPTANAVNVVEGKGQDITVLLALARSRASELKYLMNEIIKLHPIGGGDAANLTALNAVLTGLA